MCNRQFWAGLLVGVAFTSVASGGLYWSNRPSRISDPSENNDEFVEVRFRVARSNIPTPERKFQSAGALQNSGKVLDIAIEGEGYYQFKNPDGEMRYSRLGDFTVNATGNLVSKEGYLLIPEVILPTNSTSFSVGSDGSISVCTPENNGSPIGIGQFVLAKFVNPGGLAKDDSGYLIETIQSGQPTLGTPGLKGFGFTRQGFTVDNQDVTIANVFQNLASLASDGMVKSMNRRADRK